MWSEIAALVLTWPVVVLAAAVISQQQQQFATDSTDTAQISHPSTWPSSWIFWLVIGGVGLIIVVSISVWCYRRNRSFRGSAPGSERNSKTSQTIDNKNTQKPQVVRSGKAATNEDFHSLSPNLAGQNQYGGNNPNQSNNHAENNYGFSFGNQPNAPSNQLLMGTLGQRNAEPFRFDSTQGEQSETNRARNSIISACTEADSIAEEKESPMSPTMAPLLTSSQTQISTSMPTVTPRVQKNRNVVVEKHDSVCETEKFEQANALSEHIGEMMANIRPAAPKLAKPQDEPVAKSKNVTAVRASDEMFQNRPISEYAANPLFDDAREPTAIDPGDTFLREPGSTSYSGAQYAILQPASPIGTNYGDIEMVSNAPIPSEGSMVFTNPLLMGQSTKSLSGATKPVSTGTGKDMLFSSPSTIRSFDSMGANTMKKGSTARGRDDYKTGTIKTPTRMRHEIKPEDDDNTTDDDQTSKNKPPYKNSSSNRPVHAPQIREIVGIDDVQVDGTSSLESSMNELDNVPSPRTRQNQPEKMYSSENNLSQTSPPMVNLEPDVKPPSLGSLTLEKPGLRLSAILNSIVPPPPLSSANASRTNLIQSKPEISGSRTKLHVVEINTDDVHTDQDDSEQMRSPVTPELNQSYSSANFNRKIGSGAPNNNVLLNSHASLSSMLVGSKQGFSAVHGSQHSMLSQFDEQNNVPAQDILVPENADDQIELSFNSAALPVSPVPTIPSPLTPRQFRSRNATEDQFKREYSYDDNPVPLKPKDDISRASTQEKIGKSQSSINGPPPQTPPPPPPVSSGPPQNKSTPQIPGKLGGSRAQMVKEMVKQAIPNPPAGAPGMPRPASSQTSLAQSESTSSISPKQPVKEFKSANFGGVIKNQPSAAPPLARPTPLGGAGSKPNLASTPVSSPQMGSQGQLNQSRGSLNPAPTPPPAADDQANGRPVPGRAAAMISKLQASASANSSSPLPIPRPASPSVSSSNVRTFQSQVTNRPAAGSPASSTNNLNRPAPAAPSSSIEGKGSLPPKASMSSINNLNRPASPSINNPKPASSPSTRIMEKQSFGSHDKEPYSTNTMHSHRSGTVDSRKPTVSQSRSSSDSSLDLQSGA